MSAAGFAALSRNVAEHDWLLRGHLSRRNFSAGLAAMAGALPLAARGAANPSPYRAIVERYAADGHFDGVLRIVRDERVVYEDATGFADREQRRPHRLDETFRIASVTKQFTALLVMQEVERGSLALDGAISAYLSGLPAAAGAITARQLLKNISGLPNLDTIPGAYTRTDYDADDLRAYLRRLPLTPLTAPPGASFSYNNLDFIMLGAILEALTRQPFTTLVRERIVTPLALKHTGVYAKNPVDADVLGYEDDRGALVPEKIGRLANFGPAGAMYSTLADLVRWDRALLGNTLLAKAATDEMFSGDRAFGFVGLGSWSYPLMFAGEPAPVRLVERQGNIGGIQILNVLAPERNLAAIFMANTDHANLFTLYTRTGLPFEVLAQALHDTP